MNTDVLSTLSWAEVVLGAAGAGISGTLWWAHRSNIELPCASGGGCDLVNASRWAHISLGPLHDLPVALLGFLGYLALLTLAMMKIGVETENSRRLLHIPLWMISVFGAGYSWFLQYVAHFKVGAFCAWCFSSALVMTTLFVTATVEAILRARRLSTAPNQAAGTRTATHV